MMQKMETGEWKGQWAVTDGWVQANYRAARTLLKNLKECKAE